MCTVQRNITKRPVFKKNRPPHLMCMSHIQQKLTISVKDNKSTNSRRIDRIDFNLTHNVRETPIGMLFKSRIKKINKKSFYFFISIFFF